MNNMDETLLRKIINEETCKAIDEKVPPLINKAIEEKVPPLINKAINETTPPMIDNAIESLTILITHYANSVDKKFTQIDKRLDRIEKRLDKVEEDGTFIKGVFRFAGLRATSSK